MTHTLKVVNVSSYGIRFDDGSVLCSHHVDDCCETHYLDFYHISLADFEDMEFDLSGDDFFRRVEDYGIELIPVRGWPVRIPGYGYNNGYYSSNLSLVLTTPGKEDRVWDVSDCQVISD